MGEIKGILLNAWLNFLIEGCGKKTVGDAIKALGTEEESLLSTQFLAYKWYPYNIIFSLGKLTRQLKPDEPNAFSQLGRFMASYVFTGAYRSFLTKDPVKQVEKFSLIGEFFFNDTRKLETEFPSKNKCIVRRKFEPGTNSTISACESTMGFWSQTLELSGANNLKALHPKCVARGGDFCEFIFEWYQPK